MHFIWINRKSIASCFLLVWFGKLDNEYTHVILRKCKYRKGLFLKSEGGVNIGYFDFVLEISHAKINF